MSRTSVPILPDETTEKSQTIINFPRVAKEFASIGLIAGLVGGSVGIVFGVPVWIIAIPIPLEVANYANISF